MVPSRDSLLYLYSCCSDAAADKGGESSIWRGAMMLGQNSKEVVERGVEQAVGGAPESLAWNAASGVTTSSSGSAGASTLASGSAAHTVR